MEILALVVLELLHLLKDGFVAVLAEALPFLEGGEAEEFADELDLVDFGFALEEGDSAVEEFREDEAERPDVDGRGVVVVADEEFGRAVPERDDWVGVPLIGNF